MYTKTGGIYTLRSELVEPSRARYRALVVVIHPARSMSSDRDQKERKTPIGEMKKGRRSELKFLVSSTDAESSKDGALRKGRKRRKEQHRQKMK